MEFEPRPSKNDKKNRKMKAKSAAAWLTPQQEDLAAVPEPPLSENAPPPAVEVSQDLLADDRPDTSPYTSSTAELRFGAAGVQYNVPSALLPSSLAPDHACYGYRLTVYLSDTDPDIAHPLVHFLHTGKYQTLRSKEATMTARQTREHKRALSIYVAAGKYGLGDLKVLAMQKILSIESDVATEDILKQLEAVFSEISDDDDFLTNYLTAVVKKTFSTSADPSEKTSWQQLGSRFARAMLTSAAAIFADMKANSYNTYRTSNMEDPSHAEESYHMPAPPEDPAVEAECPASLETAKSESFTHDSFSVISCNESKHEAVSDEGECAVAVPATDIAYGEPEPEPYKADAQAVVDEGNAGEPLGPAVEEKAAEQYSAVPDKPAGEEDCWDDFPILKKKGKKKGKKHLGRKDAVAVFDEYPPIEIATKPEDDPACVVEPQIVGDTCVCPIYATEPAMEEPLPPAAEWFEDQWAMPVSSKKKKKKGLCAAFEPVVEPVVELVVDECKDRAEHLTAGWESCDTCRNFVLSVAQEQHRKVSEACYGY